MSHMTYLAGLTPKQQRDIQRAAAIVSLITRGYEDRLDPEELAQLRIADRALTQVLHPSLFIVESHP